MKEDFVTIGKHRGVNIDLGKVTSYMINPNQIIRLTFIGGGSLVFYTPDVEEDMMNSILNARQLISCYVSQEKFKSLVEFFDNRFTPKSLMEAL